MHDLLTFDLIQRNESRLNIKSYIDKGGFPHINNHKK